MHSLLRTMTNAWMLVLCLTALTAHAGAQVKQPDGGIEKFKKIDPHTESDPAKFAKLGYVSVGSFGWGEGNRTEDIQEAMGGLDFLWVETEHFRIGSSLGSYKITNDRTERARLKEEFSVFKKKLGRVKEPKRELDPWYRLHLYAQRAEAQYADFVKDFGLESLAEDSAKPYLGHPKKFRLLLCERKSELVRYLQAYEKVDTDISYGTGKIDGGMIFAINAEHVREGYEDKKHEPGDAMLYCRVASGLVRCFIDGHKQELFRAPRWFVQAADHYYARQVDPRWVLAGYKTRNLKDGHWEWEERVANMVENDFFPKMAEMFRWERNRELNGREHIILASKFEFMLKEKSSGMLAFINQMVTPMPNMTEESEDELDARQRKALLDGFGLEPEAFDKEWAKWAEDR